MQTAAGQAADADVVTVQLQTVTPHLDAYALVEPTSVSPINAAQSGIVTGLRVLPGAHVRAGQELARLEGPSTKAALLQSEADVRSALAQLSTAQKSLAIQTEQLASHLSTREAVHQAESTAVQAQTAFDNAQVRLESLRQMTTVSAPADAIVLALNSADGELVGAGQPILTLQPGNSLWLKAAYYSSDFRAIRIGMTGRFSPSDGSASIPIKVCAVFGTLGTGGGESIAMIPLNAKAQWLNGESGIVSLDSPQRSLVAIPTRALILDHGEWWVMVHTAQGDHPQAVVPGSAEGWNTFIERGLAPGTKVVVNNAYLLFHSSISEHYQIPD
jgi:RND family efflux transporter MFP subunit